MSTIGYIKGKVREIQPILEESTQVLMNCLEELRACGIFSEEIAHMATSVENLEKVSSLLKKRMDIFREYNNSVSSEEIEEDK